MPEDKKKVAVDTDFFQKITEADDGTLFTNLMCELNRQAVMHEYVYKEELLGNEKAKKLVGNGTIQVIEYDDYLPADRSSYERSFRMLYSMFHRTEFHGDVYTYSKKKDDLGEIRTALMAQKLGIDLMVSNDSKAKSVIESRLSSRRHPLRVFNFFDVFSSIADEHDIIKWRDVKGLAKRNMKKEKYDELNQAWHKDNLI